MFFQRVLGVRGSLTGIQRSAFSSGSIARLAQVQVRVAMPCNVVSSPKTRRIRNPRQSGVPLQSSTRPLRTSLQKTTKGNGSFSFFTLWTLPLSVQRRSLPFPSGLMSFESWAVRLLGPRLVCVPACVYEHRLLIVAWQRLQVLSPRVDQHAP